MAIISIFIAVILDWLIGDPYHWPHPIKWIGNYIYFCLKQQEKWKLNGYLFGALLWITTVSLTGGISYGVLWSVQQLHSIVYWIVWTYLAYTTLAAKSLAFEAMKVYRTLVYGTIEEARYQVGMIVGRDTTELTKEEIRNATIETVAENTSDGVIGPLLCLFIGGPVLAMIYKAINTLDSMVGYKTEKYKQMGFVSAKIDDIVNLIPARLTWLLIMLASVVCQLNVKQAIMIGIRDRYQHASPNSAFPESVVAGALGIQLGGTHVYHGQVIEKPMIGEKQREVDNQDILSTIQLLFISNALALMLFTVTALSIYIF
ncbi:cobalamin biosynthesis protein [Carnobacteriaceae bacterium zg-ZUI78]|nr:cobalamin biosynthesis protein [Carnobacteriaceae bacterium zg-ZUI78]